MVSDVTAPLLLCLLVVAVVVAVAALLERTAWRAGRRPPTPARRTGTDLCPRVELLDLADAVS